MKKIPLTNSRLLATVDDEDFREVSKRGGWHFINGHVLSTHRPQVYLHHLINGKPSKGMETDHRDGNGLNNRRSNLRNATRSQNQMNRGKQKNNVSGFKGVSWHKRDGKWWAKIGTNRRVKFLGRFEFPIEAAKAYDRAAKKFFGEFARLNFPMRFPRLARSRT